MDPTMMSVFGVGVSMAAILVVGLRSLRAEVTAVETRLGKRIDGLDSRVNGLERRLTLLEGVLSAVLRPLRRSGLPDPTTVK